jgi:hypothetical protein
MMSVGVGASIQLSKLAFGQSGTLSTEEAQWVCDRLMELDRLRNQLAAETAARLVLESQLTEIDDYCSRSPLCTKVVKS